MTKLNVLRATGTGWASAHVRKQEENPGNKQDRRQLRETVRQSLSHPDAPRGMGVDGSCVSPGPLLLMLGSQCQDKWEQPGHLCGSWEQGTCRATAGGAL